MANIVRVLSEWSQVSSVPDVPDFALGISTLPRGAISELIGNASTGRTAIAHRMLATAALGGEVSAWIDCSDTFDPPSAQLAGADLGKLLWIRCEHKLEVALKAADLILHSGGFGLIVLDLCDAPVSGLRRIPLPYWYRIRRAIEQTSFVLVVIGRDSIAKSCAARQFVFESPRGEWRGLPPFQILNRLETRVMSRKPMGGSGTELELLGELAEVV